MCDGLRCILDTPTKSRGLYITYTRMRDANVSDVRKALGSVFYSRPEGVNNLVNELPFFSNRIEVVINFSLTTCN